MGMDVCGIKNQAAYFRSSAWSWHPLWELCCELAPELTASVKRGHTNDGDGLDEADSLALSRKLGEAIRDLRASDIIERELLKRCKMTDVDCLFCNMTGYRFWPDGRRTCNGCHGLGRRRPDDTHYNTSIREVLEFAAFLEICGGFKIL